jgi:hypothetical protein
MMHEFSPDETRRWDAWQRAYAISARRSDLACRAGAIALMTAALVALVIGLLQR